MRISGTILFIFFTAIISNCGLYAQSVHQVHNPYIMDIPQVSAMAGSPSHLYILSKNDGLIVFRSLGDSLQWLYTAPKVSQRANIIYADARFAYLLKDSLNLTIVDPTEFDGKLASVRTPSSLYGTIRWNSYLYMALGTGGLGRISLNSMHSKRSAITKVHPAF